MTTIPTPRNDHITTLAVAREWIATDRANCRDDIARLGLDEAARHNAIMAQTCVDDGDLRWLPVTASVMREAMEELGS